jgi:hypothetical protein
MRKFDVLQLITFFTGSFVFGVGCEWETIFVMVFGIALMILSVVNLLFILKITEIWKRKLKS